MIPTSLEINSLWEFTDAKTGSTALYVYKKEELWTGLGFQDVPAFYLQESFGETVWSMKYKGKYEDLIMMKHVRYIGDAKKLYPEWFV